MIDYQYFKLENGLQVYVHEDPSVEVVAFNLMYNVGSRDEAPNKTGFAHLFEHLMFGGSANIQDFDKPLQQVGGTNNAFTSPDVTNYYMTLPANNLETAFWLESDRMLSLSFDPNVLEVQRKVVIEEFKQRYLDQPYGDVWLLLRPLAYKEHPYRWATIGKDIAHIEQATMQDVKDFFYRFYRPNNAVLVVAGKTTTAEVRQLAQKWFAPIPAGDALLRKLPQESKQTAARFLEVERPVPVDMLYKVFPMCKRTDTDYYASDLLSDVLGRGRSSRLYQNLVKKELFTSINAYVTGSVDEGLLVFSGKPHPKLSLSEANELLENELEKIQNSEVEASELEKVKNQAEASLVFDEVQLLNRAMQIAYGAVMGNANMVNEEKAKIQAVSAADIQAMAKNILQKEKSNTLFYRSEN